MTGKLSNFLLSNIYNCNFQNLVIACTNTTMHAPYAHTHTIALSIEAVAGKTSSNFDAK